MDHHYGELLSDNSSGVLQCVFNLVQLLRCVLTTTALTCAVRTLMTLLPSNVSARRDSRSMLTASPATVSRRSGLVVLFTCTYMYMLIQCCVYQYYVINFANFLVFWGAFDSVCAFEHLTAWHCVIVCRHRRVHAKHRWMQRQFELYWHWGKLQLYLWRRLCATGRPENVPA